MKNVDVKAAAAKSAQAGVKVNAGAKVAATQTWLALKLAAVCTQAFVASAVRGTK